MAAQCSMSSGRPGPISLWAMCSSRCDHEQSLRDIPGNQVLLGLVPWGLCRAYQRDEGHPELRLAELLDSTETASNLSEQSLEFTWLEPRRVLACCCSRGGSAALARGTSREDLSACCAKPPASDRSPPKNEPKKVRTSSRKLTKSERRKAIQTAPGVSEGLQSQAISQKHPCTSSGGEVIACKHTADAGG